MANRVRAVVTMPQKSGIATDTVQTHLVYNWPSGTDPVGSDYTSLAAAIAAFFNTTATGASGTICSRLADTFDLAANKMAVTFYNIPVAKGPLGAPVARVPWTLTSTGGTGLPAEVSIVLSMRGSYGSDVEFGPGSRPRAHDRNRMFLGPWSVATIAEDSTVSTARPSSGIRTDLLAAADQKLNLMAVGAGWHPLVFSPATWQSLAVAEYSVDNAFDTQRRRGPAPTIRQALAAS